MKEIRIPADLMARMQRHVAACWPEEGCGLVAGRDGRALEVAPVENRLHSPIRYRMDPAEQVRELLRFRANGWDLLAIFHSHPEGDPIPSGSDVEQAAYPDSVHLIWALKGQNWTCRGYLIRGSDVRAVAVFIV